MAKKCENYFMETDLHSMVLFAKADSSRTYHLNLKIFANLPEAIAQMCSVKNGVFKKFLPVNFAKFLRASFYR